MRPPRHPYALDTPTFTFAALATFAGRAPLGGAREVGILAFATARMADDLRAGVLSAEERQARAAGTRRWMTAFVLPDPVRHAFHELIAATEQDAPAAGAALRRVIAVTAAQLDAASRSELDRLARELEAQTVVGT